MVLVDVVTLSVVGMAVSIFVVVANNDNSYEYGPADIINVVTVSAAGIVLFIVIDVTIFIVVSMTVYVSVVVVDVV